MKIDMSFTKGIGTPSYMSPEILNRQKYRNPSDIFSFSITMYEVFSWKEAYPKSKFKFPWNMLGIFLILFLMEKDCQNQMI